MFRRKQQISIDYNIGQMIQLDLFAQTIETRITGYIAIDKDVLEFIESYYGPRKGVACGYVLCELMVINERMQTSVNLVIMNVEK